jgi:hypothetical protein
MEISVLFVFQKLPVFLCLSNFFWKTRFKLRFPSLYLPLVKSVAKEGDNISGNINFQVSSNKKMSVNDLHKDSLKFDFLDNLDILPILN